MDAASATVHIADKLNFIAALSFISINPRKRFRLGRDQLHRLHPDGHAAFDEFNVRACSAAFTLAGSSALLCSSPWPAYMTIVEKSLTCLSAMTSLSL